MIFCSVTAPSSSPGFTLLHVLNALSVSLLEFSLLVINTKINPFNVTNQRQAPRLLRLDVSNTFSVLRIGGLIRNIRSLSYFSGWGMKGVR